jgi:hypothetical protein
MNMRALAGLLIAGGLVFGCTTFSDLKADPDLIGSGSGTSGAPGNCKTANNCVIAPDGTVLGGGKGAECKVGADCASTICQEGACTEPLSTDGVKNGTETDVDCGGTAPTNAPKCLEGKVCKGNDDCHWGTCNGGKCGGDVKGQKDGDQTDIDCGGAQSPPCDWGQGCLFDRDCGPTGKCGADKKCLIGPSCNVVHGGTTCGTGEFGEAGKKHETCCKSLLVEGFTDSKNPGKLVYVDKYEITAGRMRAFLDTLAADPANDKRPDVKAWVTAHTPSRWNKDWTDFMAEGWEEGSLNFTVGTSLNYPDEAQMAANPPNPTSFQIIPGTYPLETGLFNQLGSPHFFPEFQQTTEPKDYAATHNLNCVNNNGSFGFSTFWFDAATQQNASGSLPKAYSKDEMDEKALNCTPFGLFAAFCAWDGGQLLTDEAFDFIAGGTWPTNPAEATATPPPRLTGSNTSCGPDGTSLITGGDSTVTCEAVYAFPDPAKGGDFDASWRVAPPGRVATDTVAINAGDEPWHDLKGNLNEGVLRKDGQFTFRGYGIGWSSIQAHRTQETTPRMKAGSFGARCMRFRDTPAPK